MKNLNENCKYLNYVTISKLYLALNFYSFDNKFSELKLVLLATIKFYFKSMNETNTCPKLEQSSLAHHSLVHKQKTNNWNSNHQILLRSSAGFDL